MSSRIVMRLMIARRVVTQMSNPGSPADVLRKHVASKTAELDGAKKT